MLIMAIYNLQFPIHNSQGSVNDPVKEFLNGSMPWNPWMHEQNVNLHGKKWITLIFLSLSIKLFIFP